MDESAFCSEQKYVKFIFLDTKVYLMASGFGEILKIVQEILLLLGAFKQSIAIRGSVMIQTATER